MGIMETEKGHYGYWKGALGILKRDIVETEKGHWGKEDKSENSLCI